MREQIRLAIEQMLFGDANDESEGIPMDLYPARVEVTEEGVDGLADAIMAIVRSSDLAWQCSVDTIVKLKQARQELWTAHQSVSQRYAYLAPGVKVATSALNAFDKALQIQGLLDVVTKESPATVTDSSD